MKRRRRTALSRIFTTGPWRPEDGDTACPSTVLGVPVSRRLSSNPDGSGALVRLADGRFAITGHTVMVGLPGQVRRFLRTQRRPDAESSWLKEIRPLLRRNPGVAGSDRNSRA